MKYKFINIIGVAVILTGFLATTAFAENHKDAPQRKNTLSKVNGSPTETKFNINRISTYLYNDGQADIRNSKAGLTFPIGSGKTAIFQTGFVWGGKVNGQIRVGGVTYQSGLVPGAVKNGVPESRDADNVRIYRVRPDYKTGTMNNEINDGEGTDAEIRTQYEKDWNEWPAADGAPFEDKDGDGKYNPAVDVPGVPGANQTIWFVSNDFNNDMATSLYGSGSMGLECQVTIWGYSVTGPLNNMFFKKYKLINKGGKDITDMYVSVWSDPDDGDSGDDYAACDTTLSLAYCYNATTKDAMYGTTPPACGFDFFQGPIVSGTANDTARFDGHLVFGKKNLPMTAFYYFINQDNIYKDPVFASYEKGTLWFYNLLQGKIGTTGEYFPIPPKVGTGVTKFPLSGDPVKGTGYLDGVLFPAGDRRIGSASGPFTMAARDTQEIVVAEICAGGPDMGIDNIAAVELLKNYDKSAQKAYDNFFVVPSAPQAPIVTVSELDKKIVLDWGSDEKMVTKTEGHDQAGFKFQGYNVYQLPTKTASKEQAKRIATFDIVDGVTAVVRNTMDIATKKPISYVEQYGTDCGVQRFFEINRDYLTNQPLVNGQKYYFAVTAYAYTEDPVADPNNLENPITSFTVIPHSPDPGVRYTGTPGDTIKVTRLSGVSDGKILPIVVDPKAVTGHDYKVEFEAGQVPDGQGGMKDGVLWKVTDVTANVVKVQKQLNQAGDNAYLTVDGVMIKVFGSPEGMKVDDINTTDDKTKWGWDAPAGTRRWTFNTANPGTAYDLEGFQGAIGSGPRFWNWFNGDGATSVTYDKLKNVLLKLAATDANGNVVDGPNVSYAYRYLRSAQNAPAKPEFAQYIINKTASFDFQDFNKNFPFAAYDMESNPPRRLAVGYLENNVATGLVDGKYWPQVYTSADAAQGNVGASSPREWFFIFDQDYKETVDPSLAINMLKNVMPIMYVGVPLRRSAAAWSDADQFALYANHPNTAKDAWLFTSKSVTVDQEQEKADVEMINVFPNPYYGVNPQEINKYQRFVTFNHLPVKATIRIFNLAGQLVRTIQKDAPGQFQQWDLNNENGLPVASGLYIIHVDMPDLGKTKILKASVIQEQQILDRF